MKKPSSLSKKCCDCGKKLLVPTWKRCQDCDRINPKTNHWYRRDGVERPTICKGCEVKKIPHGRRLFCSANCRIKFYYNKKNKVNDCKTGGCNNSSYDDNDYCRHCRLSDKKHENRTTK